MERSTDDERRSRRYEIEDTQPVEKVRRNGRH